MLGIEPRTLYFCRYTYGEENSTVEGVDTQIRRLGVDGCIVDNINRFKSIKDSSEVEEEVLVSSYVHSPRTDSTLPCLLS